MENQAEFDAFFAGKPQEWEPAEALRRALLARWPDTTMRAMKTCLSFDDPKPYCYLSHPPRKGMRGVMVTFSLPEPMEHPRFFMVVPVSKRRFTVHVLLEDASQADEELLGFIAASRR